MKKLSILALTTSLLLAVQSAPKPQNNDLAEVIATGQKASQLLLKTLGGNLKKHLKKGGPADALEFCAMRAAELTAKVDNELGKNVSIKRVTLKSRNPANEAQGDERAVLEALEKLKQNSVLLPKELVEKTKDGYKYYKPLVINKPVCLKCHGQNIDPKLQAKIKSIYPTDKAIGYKMGDLRGAIVVEIKK
ncbi:DUF3365 domain-containing protein [Nitratiruptor sp. YY09-18]|uniref:Tll0287-like domain-containing protein n=1 Tax=Nitratiruptor sp. YY09-18 TaxID=2724901 RepID=UPI0019150D13|nr:DUF3365 domain-containing protein [Nitratiruptor sp. YY09-18]BCD67251.1 cytochrome c family protein [Nitratiruptor sp. YY09-18]